MSDDYEFIRKKIQEKRDEVQRLDRDRQRLMDQISAYEELLPAEKKEQPARAETVDAEDSVKQRGLSEQTRRFMGKLKMRDSFGFDEAVQDANAVGLHIEKKSMRPRLHQYVQGGYVSRLSDGVFQLTKKGIAAAAD